MKKHSKFLAVCLAAVLMTTSIAPVAADENAQPIDGGETALPSDPSVPPEVTNPDPAYNDSHEQGAGITEISGLLLVNKNYHLPADYAPAYTAGAGQTTLLQGDAQAAADAFLAAANAQGNSMYILSGYRSYGVQAELFASYAAQHGEEAANMFSARAGQSEHQTGLAFDVGDAQHPGYNLETSIDQFPGVQWMMAHCAEYGFILRYPKDKTDITGYQYEPWHFRYVGVEAAQDIMASGLTLEEYLGVADTPASGGRRMAIGKNANSLNIDGSYTTAASYNIDGNNYFRLRDLATLMSGSGAAFDVGYDSASHAITIQSHTPLSQTPSLIVLDSNDVAVPNTMSVLLDGTPAAPTAYNIGGFTYFKLRDLGQLLGFGVTWDTASQSMVINTEDPALMQSLMEPVLL